MHNTEVITMDNKDKRNRMYEDLRKNGDHLERQVVRFSGYEPTGEVIAGKGLADFRLVYRQTWSVAYPKS